MSENAKDPPSEYQLIGPAEDGTIGDLLAGKSAKESRQRLQALIAEWLRMENLVVLTGAGTSVSSGGKVMNDLEHAVLNTLQALLQAPAGIGAVINERLAPTSFDFDLPRLSFEDWLSFLVNAHFIGAAPNSPFAGVRWKNNLLAPVQSDLAWFVEHVSAAIFAECALALPDTGAAAVSAADVTPHLAFLAKLVARDSSLGRAHLFTLNYDTLFEQALEMLGIQYFDGFTGRADARFDPTVYGLDVYYPGEVSEGRVRQFDKFLHFYKLHGSIHWQLRDGDLRARHPDLRAFANYHELEVAPKAAILAKEVKGLPTVGILPTANKFAQTLAMPFAHLFRAFQSRLAAPQTFLLVLGYGFGDDHITRILEDALMNPSLVMLVVSSNPECGTITRVRRYKDLGKRAFVLTPTSNTHRARPLSLQPSTIFLVGLCLMYSGWTTSCAYGASKSKFRPLPVCQPSILPHANWNDRYGESPRHRSYSSGSRFPCES